MPKRNYSEYADNSSEATCESDIYGEGVRPMRYTTLNKLKKHGAIKDHHMIGGVLAPETAKDLYKNNTRIHHRYYGPADKKRYFYDSEITGGKLNLGKAFKKIGSTIKHTFENVGKTAALGIDKVNTGLLDLGGKAEQGLAAGAEAVKNFGEKSVEKVGKYTDVVLHGRDDYPPKVRDLIAKYGNDHITKIIIDRTPVVGVLTSALNVISLGAFKKKMEEQDYDKVFHLRMDLTFENGKKLAVEKNEVINMYEDPKKLKGSEQIQIAVPSGLTLNQMLTGAQKIQGKKYFRYSAYNNNCQDFIVALMKAGGFGSQQDFNFVKQNAKALFKNDAFTRKFANTVTDIGGKVNEITQGAGLEDEEGHIQSIVFDKDHWTKRRAVTWLKKHGYHGIDCDEKEHTLRFRQFPPSDKYRYITKSLPGDIELIITYKNKTSTNKYNKMNGRRIARYESDSDSCSDSDSDTEFSGSGLKHEKEIIRKMNDLRREIKGHHRVHGGKINIGKAFKKLGSTIKDDFEKETMAPAFVKTAKSIEKAIVPAANKVGHYVTAKKGGLASDVITYGIPAASSALLGGLATTATGGNPAAGVAASALGSKLGAMGAEELKKKTGTGMKKRGRPAKTVGDLVHIDIGSHNARRDISEGKGFKKGSPEAKEHMARIRAMRKTR
jgi:hypothetical protein